MPWSPPLFIRAAAGYGTHIGGGRAMKTLRRSLIRLALAAALFAIPFQDAAAQAEPLRLGFLTVRTGPLAAGGRQMEEGINLLLKERNNTFAGRKVEIFFADTAGQPALAKTKTQELVEREKVHVVIGPLATFEALAIDEYVLQSKVPLITPTSAAQNDLAQQKKSESTTIAASTVAAQQSNSEKKETAPSGEKVI